MKTVFFLVILGVSSGILAMELNAQSKEDSLSLMPQTDSLPLDSLLALEELTTKDSIKYSANYQFRDGFYLSRKSFLSNTPITLDKVLTTVPYTDPDIYEKILSMGSMKLLTPENTYKYYNVSDIFGFVQNRVFFINLRQHGFVRMTNLGKISKVSFGAETPRVQPVGGVGMNSWGGSSVGVGIQVNGNSSTTHFIFRIEGGPMVEFTPEMLLEMIKDDEIMFNNYLGMNKRFRMKEMHNVLQEYNRRNPLYLPIYK